MLRKHGKQLPQYLSMPFLLQLFFHGPLFAPLVRCVSVSPRTPQRSQVERVGIIIAADMRPVNHRPALLDQVEAKRLRATNAAKSFFVFVRAATRVVSLNIDAACWH
jgi:hypothetical protein